MMIKNKFIGAAFLILFFACCPKTPEGNENNTSSDYRIQAKMIVDSWSVHLAQDKRQHWQKSEYKEKIVLHGVKTDSSTHQFEKATIWYHSGGDDSIHFDSVNGHLTTFYPREHFDKMYHILNSDHKISISYSLNTKGDKHVIFSASKPK